MDHYLKYFPIILEKIINKENVNLLQNIPKHKSLYSKNLYVVIRYVPKNNENISHQSSMKGRERYLNPSE